MEAVKVKWVDSVSGDCYWSLLEDFKASLVEAVTYGFIVYEDDKKISIAQTYAEGDENTPQQINGTMTIPKCAILEIIKL